MLSPNVDLQFSDPKPFNAVHIKYRTEGLY